MVDHYFHQNFFSQEEVVQLNQHIESNYNQIETAKNQSVKDNGYSKNNTKILMINIYKIKDLVSRLESYVKYVNESYFGFDVYPFNDHDTCLLNIYKPDGEYDYHTDHSRNDVFDIKLTVLANLSTQDFEGGDFKIFNGGEYDVPGFRPSGSILIFKSYLSHKVSPIISGERRSLTIFARGPHLK